MKSTLRDHYEKFFKIEENDCEELYLDVPEKIKRAMIDVKVENAVATNLKALDLGYGYGKYVLELLKYGYNVDAVDIVDPEILECKIPHDFRKNINILNYDLNSFILKERYDFIISRNVLHFLPKSTIKRLLQEISDKIKRKGLIHIEIFTDIKRYKTNTDERIYLYNEAQFSSNEFFELVNKVFNEDEFSCIFNSDNGYSEYSRENKNFTYFYANKIIVDAQKK